MIVDESTLAGVDIPEARAIAEYLLIQKRVAMVESWIESVSDDNRIHGKVITNGAVTGRMTHSSPNMAQVPSVGSEYGPECRSLFIVEKGYKLVGCDAASLELRMLTHYMKDEQYAREIVEGDIHTKTRLRQVLKLGRKPRHSFTLYSMAQVLPRSGKLLVVRQRMVRNSSILFFGTRQVSKDFVTRLRSYRYKDRFQVLTVGDYSFVPHTQHLTRYCRVLVR